MTTGKQPMKRFQSGGVSAALWQNTNRSGFSEYESVSVTLDRRYKDQQGNWKNSSSFSVNDLPKAILVLNQAFEYLTMKDREPVEGERPLIEEGNGFG